MNTTRSIATLITLTWVAFGADITTVHFQSDDRKTGLTGYFFEPAGSGPHV